MNTLSENLDTFVYAREIEKKMRVMPLHTMTKMKPSSLDVLHRHPCKVYKIAIKITDHEWKYLHMLENGVLVMQVDSSLVWSHVDVTCICRLKTEDRLYAHALR